MTALGRSTRLLIPMIALSAFISEAVMAAPLHMPVPIPAPAETVHKAQFFWPFGQRQYRRDPRRSRQPNYFRSQPPPQRQQAPTVQRPSKPRGPVASVFGEAPAVDNAVRVVVFGDSLATDLADALAAALPESKGFQVQRMTRSSSGLVRADYYDWNGELAAAIADQRIDIAVVFVGINDNQAMPLDGVHHQPRSPAWVETYTARVDNFIRQLREKETAVYWVGAPITRLQSHSKGMAFINTLTRERAQLQGAQYIDIWDAFADENGNYSSDGPDLSGTRRKMRRANGIHFTESGNEKLAHFVTQAIERDLSVATLGADGRRIIRQSVRGGLSVAGGGEAGADVLAGGGDDDLPGEDGLGGPSIALSTIGSGGKTDGEQVMSPLFTVLMRGEALEPKPGRADDFAWPRTD